MSQTTTPQSTTLIQSILLATGLASLIIFVSSATLMWAATGVLLDGLAVGSFAAIWGGPGFGVIAGGAANTMSTGRREASLHQEATAQHAER